MNCHSRGADRFAKNRPVCLYEQIIRCPPYRKNHNGWSDDVDLPHLCITTGISVGSVHYDGGNSSAGKNTRPLFWEADDGTLIIPGGGSDHCGSYHYQG
jgi:hypothetical protein